jgi:hypothetical protein
MAARNQPIEAAEAEAKREGYIITAYDLGQFRTGYQRGRAQHYIERIIGLCHYMNRQEIENLTAKLETLYDQTKIEMWGEDK